MACGSCPGGGGRAYASPPAMQALGSNQRILQPREGYVILQYNGPSVSTRTYKGKATGTQYRFGNTPIHRTKYVYGQDVPPLLELMDGGRPLFEIITPSALPDQDNRPEEPQLVAAGAPVRADVPVREVTSGVLAQPVLDPPLPAAPESATSGEAPSSLREYSLQELRTYSKDWSRDKVEFYLAHEEGKDEPRATAVTLLKGRLNAKS